MTAFLTVKEAARTTGKSPSSIRRIIHPIIKDDAHKDRDQVRPGVEEAQNLRMKGVTFAWQLSEDLLRREIPADAGPEKGSAGSAPRPGGSAEAELLALLRQELDFKNKQLAENTELMKALGERLREGNILMATLQQHLALGDGRGAMNPEKVTPTSEEPVKPKPPKSGKGSDSNPKPKVKPGFFDRPRWLPKWL